MKNVHIIGSGGLSKELIGYIIGEDKPRYNILGCWGTKPFNNEKYNSYYKGSLDCYLKSYKAADIIFIAIASPKKREKIYMQLSKYDVVFESYIHPTCQISKFAEIGNGCIFAPHTMLTGDPVIKNFVFANTEVVIGHDSLISDYCTLYPKVEICGDCKIGEKCVFGIGSIVLPKISVSANSKLDAGSILRKSILKSSLYSGNPAEIVTPKKQETRSD